MKSFAVVSCTSLTLLSLACGQVDNAREQNQSSAQLSADSGASEQAVAASFSEALSSLSDGNLSPSTTSLALANPSDTVTSKSCSVSGDKAVVDISLERSLSWEKQLRRFLVSMSSSIKSQLTRTWSKEGTAIACNDKSAAIDFESNLEGYQLDVKINRTIERSFQRKNTQTSETVARSYSASVEGERSVSWIKQEVNADGSISREREVSFKLDRTSSFQAKDGSNQALALSLTTAENDPLHVINTWDTLSKGRQLLSQEIKSGTILAEKAGDAKIEASFSAIKLTFSSSSCQVMSGQMSAKLYPAGSSEASKSFLLSAEDGVVTVQDVTDPANPKDVEDFEYSPCDIRDFKD